MSAWSAWVAAGLLGVALLSAVLVQVPLHARLAEHHDADAIRRLIVSNWVRTVAWTARGWCWQACSRAERLTCAQARARL